MMRRVGVHFLLLFALVFQNIALAMPCCEPAKNIVPTEYSSIEYTEDHSVQDVAGLNLHEEDCMAGSPLCCAVPSLPNTTVVAAIENLASVYVPTVHAFRISFYQVSPERPPRA